MASYASDSAHEWLPKHVFGYRRRDVDEYVNHVNRLLREKNEEITRLHEASSANAAVGKHLAALITRFADSVAAGEQEATEQANTIVANARAEAEQILADAREIASRTFTEAERRYETAKSARELVSQRLEDTMKQMANALVALNTGPELPDLEPAAPVVSGTGQLLRLTDLDGVMEEDAEEERSHNQ